MLYMYWNIANIQISFIKPEVEKNIESKHSDRKYTYLLNNYSMPVCALYINNYSMQHNSHYLSTRCIVLLCLEGVFTLFNTSETELSSVSFWRRYQKRSIIWRRREVDSKPGIRRRWTLKNPPLVNVGGTTRSLRMFVRSVDRSSNFASVQQSFVRYAGSTPCTML